MLAHDAHKETTAVQALIVARVKDFTELVKLRLNLLVVFSTIMGYLFAAGMAMEWTSMLALAVGGFLVVGAANGLNQVIEKQSDRLMSRTQNRPVAQERMSVAEAVFISTLMGIIGISMLALFLNPLSGWISFISLVLYAFAYTPLKKRSPVAVFVGAFPGALPPLIGYTAFAGEITMMGIFLFGIQFFWQFPHFWAIAWVMHDDYKKAGFKLLPLGENKNASGALQILMFTILLLPMGLLPAKFGFTGNISAIFIVLCGLVFSWQAWQLYVKLDDKSAKQLMFGSFFYLPLVLIALLTDKIV